MRLPTFRTGVAALALLAPSLAFAQGPTAPPSHNSFAAGFGMTSICNTGGQCQPFYLINASPEFNLGMVAVGLDLNLRYSADSGLAKEDWRDWRAAFNAIRYVRFGSKEAQTPVYVRVGALDQSSLGYGQVMYNYNNSPNYDGRKRGAEVALNFGMFGVETMYGNLTQPEVVGARAYIRPLHSLSIPIVSRLEVGGTIAADMGDHAGDVAGVDQGTPTVYGADIGLPLVANPFLRWTVYGDMAQIKDAGHGSAIGTQATFSGLGLVRIAARLESRQIGDQYVPSYFNSFYELERYNAAGLNGNPAVKTRYEMVRNMTSSGSGAYGEITGDVINVITLTGAYQRLYSAPSSGWLHMSASTGDKVPMFSIKGSYDKWGIDQETGIFKLDDHSLAQLETGYRMNRFMTVGLLTSWTFAPTRNASGDVIGYLPQKRIEPKVSFGFAF